MEDTLSRVTNDVDVVSQSLQQTIIQVIASLISMVGVTIMMLSISPGAHPAHHGHAALQHRGSVS